MDEYERIETGASGFETESSLVPGNRPVAQGATTAGLAPEDILDAKSSTSQATEFTTAQSIPLVCIICPKNTKFSDVSHLLTHISSKGHLSNMFKLDIAKYTDEDARARLEQYQSWFDEHNIRELLQNRSENRVQKVACGRGRSTRRGPLMPGLRGRHVSLVSRNQPRESNEHRNKQVSILGCFFRIEYDAGDGLI